MRPSSAIAYHCTAALTLALSASIVLAAAAPTPPPQTRRAASEGRSPVRCNADASRHEGMLRRGSARSPHFAPPVTMPSIAAPPPPPYAPPAIIAEQSDSIVVTGTSVSPSARFAPSPMPIPAEPYGSPGNSDRYAGRAVAAVQDVAANPVSTFSVDVDTGAYANARRFLRQGQPVPPEAVRTEEFINYFRYDYPRPASQAEPFSVTTDVATTPWNPDTRLLRIGLRGYDVTSDTRPAANLVFLVDVSGSMDEPDKLPLVQTAMRGLADNLRAGDRVSIVVYAGAAGVVLEPTSNKEYVKAAISCLQSGGSTAGGQGIELAYATARATFMPGGVNRIFLATDGDFNVGVSDNKALEELVKRNRDDGITLTTLGFGQGNYNEAMMERIADVGNGNYSYIDSASEARKVLGEELSATMVTIAKDVKIQVEFNPAQVAQYRLLGYENRALLEEDFTNDAVDAGDIGAGHQVTALYEVVPAGAPGWTRPRRYETNRPTPARSGGDELAHVKLRYKLPDGRVSREIARAVPAALLRSAAAPTGDMAFATAVAAFGQRLRGDAMLRSYGYADIRRLAGSGGGYWRDEFGELTTLADRRGGGATTGAR